LRAQKPTTPDLSTPPGQCAGAVMKHPIFYTALSVLLLAGCVRSDVTRFHNLPKSGGGNTIVILPSDPAKKGGIEFRTYAQIVAGYFAKNGYVVLQPSNPNADFAAFFDYSIGGGKTEVGSTPIIGQTGGGTTYQSGTMQFLWWGVHKLFRDILWVFVHRPHIWSCR